MREIKRTLRREATTSHTKAMGHMLEITRIVLALSSMILGFPHSVQAVDPLTAATTSAFESGMSPVSPWLISRLLFTAWRPHSLRAFSQARVLSPRTPLPDRGDIFEQRWG